MNDTDKIIQELIKQQKRWESFTLFLVVCLVGCLVFIGLAYFNGMLNI